MSSFEWMELQTLASDIAIARSQLAQARADRDDRSVRTLEQEINAAEARRAQVLAHISSHVSDNGEQSAAAGGDVAGLGLPSVGAIQASIDETEQPVADFPEPVLGNDAVQTERVRQDPVLGNDPAQAEPAERMQNMEGGVTVWDQVTPQDLERAKEEIETRRAEMLARHAEELKTLEADYGQLAELEQAIAMFMRKFSAKTGEGAVVSLGDEREMRLQA